MLKFDKQGLANEILKNLEIELHSVTIIWQKEALSKMRGIKFAYEKENLKAEVDKEIIRQSNQIIVYLKANTVALADSYGVGSLMTSDNPGLRKYMQSISKENGTWNPARRGKTIVGRPEGYYTDIFGRKRHSSGKLKGIKLEGKKIYTKKDASEQDYYISPSKPSYAIQLATNWLYKTYLPRAYKLAIQRTNFSKYLKEVN